MRRLLPALLACCLLPLHAAADDREAAQRQLENGRREISDLQKQLTDLRQEKSDVLKRLKGTEQEMSELLRQINSLEQQLRESEKDIERLDGEKKKLQSQRDEQRKLIATQARAAYQGGQQEYIKLLLNQEQPEQLTRLVTYHDYMARARSAQMASYQATLEQLRLVEAELTDRHALLAGQRFELQSRKDSLNQKVAQQKQLAAKLNQEMGSGEQRLRRLQQEQAETNEALQQIESRLARQREQERQAEKDDSPQLAQRSSERPAERPVEKPADKAPERAVDKPAERASVVAADTDSSPLDNRTPFAKTRGRLPWPVNGEVMARYGSEREGSVRWDGMVMAAPGGTRVRAIHSGRVVFANWMKSLGMLMIIDHGSGYLSLYGFNQTLLKNVNDQVSAGEVIATVGSSGGQSTPALYFSIRQNGQPVDPQTWCRNQG